MSRKNLRVQVTGLFAPLVNDFFLFLDYYLLFQTRSTTFILVFKHIQYSVLKRITDSLKSTFWYRPTVLSKKKKRKCLQGFSPSRWLDARPVSNFILVHVARAFGSPSCVSHFILVVVALHCILEFFPYCAVQQFSRYAFEPIYVLLVSAFDHQCNWRQ